MAPDAELSAVQAPSLDNIPVYKSFLEEPELYCRIHVHLIGAFSTDGGGIRKRRNKLGGRHLVRDKIADPYVIVKTVGSDTGSTDYFPIGTHTFKVLENCRMPLWDAKCLLICKKDSTDSVKFTMLDENRRKDEVLMEVSLPLSDLPAAGEGWKEFSQSPSEGPMKNMELAFSIKVTDCANHRIVSKEDTDALCLISGTIQYKEETLLGDTNDDEDNALLQCWRTPGNNSAVLWILGRNDCFMHPHVAKPLFFEQNYDVYVLNYSQNGRCRTKGWVHDAHCNSHNKHGDFNVYNRQIDEAIDIINRLSYETVLGYAHSTGGPVLINYLMENNDEEFDGFIFNSPFLDWGYVGGDMVEFVLENVGFMERIGVMPLDTKMGAAATPASLAKTPLHYLGEDIVLSEWAARIWSLYHFGAIDPSTRCP